MRKVCLFIMLCAMLSACDDQRIVNKICLVHAVGFDAIANGNGIQSAAQIAHYKEQGKTELQLIHTDSNSIIGAFPRLNSRAKDLLVRGQLRLVLFGKTLAEQGTGNEMHNLLRDPKISSRLQLGVVDRDASELLEIIKKNQEPYFLSDMIEQNMRNGNLPMMNLHVALFNYYGEGRDMYLPYFKIDRGEVSIGGLALFKGDRKKTEINMKDTFIFKMLIQNSKDGTYKYPVEGKAFNKQGKEFILLRSIHSKTNYVVNKGNPIPSIAIRVKLVTELKEVPEWVDLRSEEQLSQFEQSLSLYFKKEIEKFLSLLKNKKVDPVGLGDLVRSQSKEWSAQEFERKYQELKTTVSVQVKIVDTSG